MKQLKHIEHNRGIILFIALIFLFVSTLLGVSSLRANFFNEKMTLNTIQREQALEAAEIALLEGEDMVESYYRDITDLVLSGVRGDAVSEVTADAETCSVTIDGQGGVCAAKEQSASPGTNYDNWVDITSDSNSINVWTNTARHRSVNEVIKNKYGFNTSPKYIVEFMGYIVDNEGTSGCAAELADGSPNTNADEDQLEYWPYCDLDNAQFRITALGTSGNYDETRVLLQSTYVVDN